MKKLFILLLTLAATQAQAQKERETITVKNHTDKTIRMTTLFSRCNPVNTVIYGGSTKTFHIVPEKHQRDDCKPTLLKAQIVQSGRFKDIDILEKTATVSAAFSAKIDLQNRSGNLSFEAVKVSPEGTVSAATEPTTDLYLLQEL